MSFSQDSPLPKFETSPTESLLSIPGDPYSSLFPAVTPSATETMNPLEMMTPKSFSDDKNAASQQEPSSPSSPGSEKKSSKKRKSWGQVLPEPKTNLPPRKRAKTEDEKEQRRVERVLRNRRAAQSSRERKRLEVEALEIRNKELESIIESVQKQNMRLMEELKSYRQNAGIVTRSSSPLATLRDMPVTLSQELFSSQDGHKANADSSATIMDDLLVSSSNGNATLNPASLSPTLSPVDESPELASMEPSKEANDSEQTSTSPDLAQCPAETLFDPQCHTSAEMPQSFLSSPTPTSATLAWLLQLQMMLYSASAVLSACQRPLTQIAFSLKANFSLLPTPQLLTTIIWLVTIPSTSKTLTSSTSTTSSTTKQPLSLQTLWQRANLAPRTTASKPSSPTLRIKSLRAILTRSPFLARPLADATLVALRLDSKGNDDQVESLRHETDGARDQDRLLTQCLSNITLPSKEVLMTLLWTIRLEEQRIRRKADAVLDLKTRSLDENNQTSHDDIALQVGGAKRKVTEPSISSSKRSRLA